MTDRDLSRFVRFQENLGVGHDEATGAGFDIDGICQCGFKPPHHGMGMRHPISVLGGFCRAPPV